MKTEDLINAFGQIDDKIFAETEKELAGCFEEQAEPIMIFAAEKKRRMIRPYFTAAAVLVLIISLPLLVTHFANNTPADIEPSYTLGESVTAEQGGEKMPSPFDESPYTGTDANTDFYLPCSRVLNNIPAELMRLRNSSDVQEWIASFPSISIAPNSINEYENIYSFITRFDISKDEAEAALAVYLSSNDEQIRISREQFDTIFSGDVAAITKTFVSDFSIAVGEFVYCPNWIYTHSSEDYAAVGISADILAEKAAAYSSFNLTDSARAAFSAKLSEYTGKMINIEPVQSYENYLTDAAADDEIFDEGLEADEECNDVTPEDDAENPDMPDEDMEVTTGADIENEDIASETSVVVPEVDAEKPVVHIDGEEYTLIGEPMAADMLADYDLEKYYELDESGYKSMADFLEGLDCSDKEELKDLYRRAHVLSFNESSCGVDGMPSPDGIAASESRARLEDKNGNSFVETGFDYDSFYSNYHDVFTEEAAEKILRLYAPAPLSYNGELWLWEIGISENQNRFPYEEYEVLTQTDTEIVIRRTVYFGDWSGREDEFEFDREKTKWYQKEETNCKFVLTDNGWRIGEFFGFSVSGTDVLRYEEE